MRPVLAVHRKPTLQPCAKCGVEVVHTVSRWFSRDAQGRLQRGDVTMPVRHHCVASQPWGQP